MKKARPRAVAGLCVTLLLIMLVLLVPAYALAHRVSPLPDTTQTQPVDTGQPMESGASATSRYWAGYLLLGIILCAIVYFITRGRAHRLSCPEIQDTSLTASGCQSHIVATSDSTERSWLGLSPQSSQAFDRVRSAYAHGVTGKSLPPVGQSMERVIERTRYLHVRLPEYHGWG